MKTKKSLFAVALLTFSIPAVSHATKLQDVLNTVRDTIDSLVPIFITLALAYFIWGIAQFILHSDGEEARSEGKNKMLWGVIALFVIVSVWGLVGFIGSTLGVGQGGHPIVPQLPKPGSTP